MRIRYSRRNNQFAESFPVIVRRGQRRQRNRQKDETGGEEGGGEGRGGGKEKRFAHNGGLKMLAWPGRIEVFTRRIITFNENKRPPAGGRPRLRFCFVAHTPLSAINPQRAGENSAWNR